MARGLIRTLLMVVIALVVIVVVIVALLPTLVNNGLFRGRILGAIERQVTATADIDALQLGWAAPQRVRGLRLTEASGREAANLDLAFDTGFLGLVLGDAPSSEITVSGSVTGELRADGSTSLQELLVTADVTAKTAAGSKKPRTDAKPDARAEALDLGGLADVHVKVDGLRVALTFPESTPTSSLTLDDVRGAIDLADGGATVELRTPTTAPGEQGTLDVQLAAAGLVDAAGRFQPAGATVNATIVAERVPIPFAEPASTVSRLNLVARAADLADRLDFDILVESQLGAGELSQLTGTLSALAPITPAGAVQVGLDSVTGELTGVKVPTALVQPFLAGTSVLLSRDVGPTVDVALKLAAGGDAGAARPVSIKLTGERASVALVAAVAADGSVRGDSAELLVRVQPALATALLGVTVTEAVPLELRAGPFFVPARGDGGALPLDAIAVDATLKTTSPATLAFAGSDDAAPGRLPVESIKLAIAAKRLGDGAALTGTINVAGGAIEIDERLTRLMDADGSLTLGDVAPVGEIRVKALDSASIIAALLPALAPNIQAALKEAAGSAVDGTVRTSVDSAGLRAVASVSGTGVSVDGTVVRGPETVRVESLGAKLTATPALLAAIQSGDDPDVALEKPARLELTIEPFEMARGEQAGLPAELTGLLSVNGARVTHVALEKPVPLSEMTARLTAALGETRKYTVDGTARLGAEDGGLGKLVFDLTVEGGGETLRPAGRLTIESLDVERLERIAGTGRGAISGWLGERGAMTVELDGDRAATSAIDLGIDFPLMKGAFRASFDDAMISASSTDLTMTVRRAQLEKMLNPDPGAGAAIDPLTVREDVLMTVRLDELQVPLALVRGEPFDGATARVAAMLSGGPLTLANRAGSVSTLRDVKLTVKPSNAAAGLGFELTAAATGGDDGAGTVSVDGTLSNLMTSAGTFDTAGAKLDMVAKAASVPTVIADALLGLNGYLVAAAGQQMAAEFTARSFSSETGNVDMRIDTPNGFIAGRIRGRKGTLRTIEEQPLRGELELTKPFRQRLLAPLNPIFADIRTMEQPVRFNVPGTMVIPLDGDMTQMRGDFEITVGAVEFDAGSTLFGLLAVFSKSDPTATIPGLVEPIVGEIRRGVVTYKPFTVRIGEYAMRYQGTVDLVEKTVDLRTELPLAALGQSFGEVSGYVDKIVVPLVSRGSFGSVKTEIDPKFDVGKAAAEAGLRGGLGELLEKDKSGVGGVLGELLGGAKEDQ